MKKIPLYSAFIFLLTIGLFFSCNPDDGGDPAPTDPRDKFVGSWLCQETSQSGNSSFSVTISIDGSNSSQIFLDNFYHLGVGKKVYGVVAGNNVTLPNQVVNGFTVKSGNGTIVNSDTKINFSYVVNDGADDDSCTAVYTK
jgi:hypothetical protein